MLMILTLQREGEIRAVAGGLDKEMRQNERVR